MRCPNCTTDNAPENSSCWRCGLDLTPIPKAPLTAPLLDRIITEYERRGFSLPERTDSSARLLSRVAGEKRVEVDWAGTVTVDGHQMPQERVEAFLAAEPPVPSGLDMRKLGIGCGVLIGFFVLLGLLGSVTGWTKAANQGVTLTPAGTLPGQYRAHHPSSARPPCRCAVQSIASGAGAGGSKRVTVTVGRGSAWIAKPSAVTRSS